MLIPRGNPVASSVSKRIGAKAVLLVLVIPWVIAIAAPTEDGVTAAPEALVGNVYGTIRNALDGAPIAGARIRLRLDSASASTAQTAQPSRPDAPGAWERGDAVRWGRSDREGRFLVNAVPTPFPGLDYTLVVEAEGYRPLTIESARVLPGASMALQLDARLTPGEGGAETFRRGDPGTPLSYRHQTGSIPDAPFAANRIKGRAPAQTVFATREGLVGGTTANGHVIVERDRFVALPSRRALNANDSTYHYQVELSVGGRSTVAPVWDIGPWNTQDDYWNPPDIRERWTDLPQWLPQAQAAFQNGYHGGLDGKDRTVLNPAGIDLADGVFWDDLGLTDNRWLAVDFLWLLAPGDRVRVDATTLKVRAEPAGSALAYTMSNGAVGTVLDGPKGATLSGTYYLWWQVRWDDQPDNPGWSAETYLARIPPVQPLSLAVRKVDGQVEVTLTCQQGALVSLQTAPSLTTAPSWTTVTNLTFTAAEVVWRETAPLEQTRFYRAVRQ